jgi:signal transduction histidine kinase/CheY-like chemotaxis protein
LPELIRAVIPEVATGKSMRQEIAANLPTGRRVFDVSIRPVRNAAGRVIAIVPEAVEVTEQRAAEAQLRQAQKMEAVGQLTGGLAHDFNNLMTGITGNLELLAARVGPGQRTGEGASQARGQDLARYIEAAQGAARRAAALTHRLLAFSRQQTLDPRRTDVNQLVAGMEEMIRRTMGPDVAIEVAAAADLWPTFIDQNQLENALLNLCINARQAMPRGGQLTIETCNKILDARAAEERDLPQGDYVSLCVTDTGIGMPPEVIARAFDPFFTTKPIGEGTGLGLSMIYGFVRQSGGQARIYSEPGQGSTLCLYLPRQSSAASPIAPELTPGVAPGLREAVPGTATSPASAAPAPGAQKGEIVLVVDDEATVRMLVTEVLEDLGYTTISAADGPAGLAVVRSDTPLDLMISDVGLPGGMNGRELADAALSLRPALPVLFITGYAENAVVGHGHLRAGMQVLTKPFTIDALARRVKDILTASAPL